MWLSIIIPVYNCEDYIGRCLESVYKQGLQPVDFEVIIVNDGSTDNTLGVIDPYISIQSNLQVYTKMNEGVGKARNFGLEKANGDYVFFMDADDWLLPNGLSILKSYYQEDSPRDMYTFWSRTVDSKYDDSWNEIGEHRIVYEGNFVNYAKGYGFGWNVWGRIISRSFLTSNNIKFTSHIMGEDLLFMTRLFSAANGTITSTNLNFYRYFVRNDSAVNTIDKERNHRAALDYIDIYKETKNLSNSGLYPEEVYDSVLNNCCEKAFIRMISGCKDYKSLNILRRKIINEELFPVSNQKSKLIKFSNIIIKHPVSLYLLSKFYQIVFLPYIKPKIGRN